MNVSMLACGFIIEPVDRIEFSAAVRLPFCIGNRTTVKSVTAEYFINRILVKLGPT